ncbi:MAG: hypothetical protein MUE73_06830 [Planctomycetes bacterium]|jgi:hypothetical protein|nr:hypothetical protein [Planctomycetota bacterium]
MSTHKSVLTALAVFLISGLGVPSPALAGPGGGCGGGGCEGPKAPEPAPVAGAKAPTGLLVDLGNERCPIMGGKVDGKTFSEWEGLRIGHCCPGCTAALAKDPAAVLDRAKVDWREAAGAVKRVNEATGEARTKALAELRAKWKVVREPAPEAPPAAPAK